MHINLFMIAAPSCLQMQYSKFIASSATFDDKRVYHARLKGLPPPAASMRKKGN